ncbi:MAG: cation transporter [Actinomycetia bacterium]|nr:cation transporter [Actinomycetes bacterium]
MTTQITIPVEGMSCTGCENNVQFALTSLEGVEAVDADHLGRTVIVDYDPGGTSSDDLRKAIEDMGYTVNREQG